MRDTQCSLCRKFQTIAQGEERSVGRTQASWDSTTGSYTCIVAERCRSDTHSYTVMPFHISRLTSHPKIQPETPFKESISPTIFFPREHKAYTLSITNQSHKPLETLVIEFANC
jgi:hypothetical protein